MATPKVEKYLPIDPDDRVVSALRDPAGSLVLVITANGAMFELSPSGAVDVVVRRTRFIVDDQ